MLLLFLSELSYFLQIERTPELLVDIERSEKLRINVDITFPRLPCACARRPASSAVAAARASPTVRRAHVPRCRP